MAKRRSLGQPVTNIKNGKDMLFLILLAALIAAISIYFHKVYSHFSRHGIKHLPPVPLLGNMGRIVLRLDHFANTADRIYKKFSNERFIGLYEFINGVIFVRDLELIKKITVKDFEHFIDHRAFIHEDIEPMFGKNLFSLRGNKWKDMRSTLSPAFTSSKIRLMVPFIEEIGDQMINALKNKIKDSGVDYADIDCKDMTTRYANDVIASCAFGYNIDSQLNTNNQFYTMGKMISTFSFTRAIILFGYSSFPKFIEFCNVKVFDERCKKYFENLVIDTIQDRNTRNIIRPDVINILMELKKGTIKHDATENLDAGFATVEESALGKREIRTKWSDDELVAQAVLFFIAGFETASSGMSFILHELALNPDVQERLAREIKDHDDRYGGKFDYNSIQNLKYLDMVVSEVLRIWPPIFTLDRICTKDYNLGKPNNDASEYVVKKGTAMTIPVWCIHHDPAYYPDPYKFDPERFSDENKHNIKPFTYMPFGVGPRNCIGSRFALCELKIMAYKIVKEFQISPCSKTCLNQKLSRDSFNLGLDGGHWVKFKIRSP